MFLPVHEAVLLILFALERVNGAQKSIIIFKLYMRYKSGFLENPKIGNGNYIIVIIVSRDCISATIRFASRKCLQYTDYMLKTVVMAHFFLIFCSETLCPKIYFSSGFMYTYLHV